MNRDRFSAVLQLIGFILLIMLAIVGGSYAIAWFIGVMFALNFFLGVFFSIALAAILLYLMGEMIG